MGTTQQAIIEGLRTRRNFVIKSDNRNKMTSTALKAVIERYQERNVFTKNINDRNRRILNPNVHIRSINENKNIPSADTMPDGKLDFPQIIIFSSGDRYVGEICDKMANGYGVMTSSTHGDMYTGNWKNNSTDGYGTYIHSDGTIYSGYHKNGERHGVGIIYAEDEVYEVEYDNGYLIKVDGCVLERTKQKKKVTTQNGRWVASTVRG